MCDKYGVCKIYKITNLKTGKIYIGQTIKRLNLRWSNHKSPARSNAGATYIWRAIQKYGADNFKMEWIASAVTKDKLDSLEEYMIISNNSLAPNGYNIKLGGPTAAFTDEQKKLMSEGQKRRYAKMTKEERQDGTKQLREYIENKKVKLTAINIKTNEVKVFTSILESEEAGFSHSAIYSSLDPNKNGTSKGFHFFKTENHTIDEMFKLAKEKETKLDKANKQRYITRQSNPNMQKHIESQKVPYIGINPKTLEYQTFNSMSEAVRAGYNTDAMRRGARGEKRTTKKMHFQRLTLTPQEHIEITKSIFKR